MSLAGYSDHDKVSAIRYEHPGLFTNNPIEFQPQGLWTPLIDPENIVYQSMFRPFSVNQYLYPRPPVDMGWQGDMFSDHVVNVLRMPLKFPHTDYKMPRQMEALEPLIRRVAEYEKFINKDHDACFCHITHDHSTVQPNEYHRFPGFHGDGIQGQKLTPKVNVEHSYVLVSKPPTEFCLQPFFLKHMDEAKHNFFLEFDRQAKETNVYGSLTNHLYLIDPYMVHRSPKISALTERVFIRITYAFTELQHPKNTINPLFDGQEYHKRIDIRENLTENEFEVPWHLYGLSKGN